MKSLFTTAAVVAILAAMPAMAVTKGEVLDNYANIAQANFGDALTLARVLDKAVGALIADPSAEKTASCKNRMAGRTCALPADRSLPFWQCYC